MSWHPTLSPATITNTGIQTLKTLTHIPNTLTDNPNTMTCSYCIDSDSQDSTILLTHWQRTHNKWPTYDLLTEAQLISDSHHIVRDSQQSSSEALHTDLLPTHWFRLTTTVNWITNKMAQRLDACIHPQHIDLDSQNKDPHSIQVAKNPKKWSYSHHIDSYAHNINPDYQHIEQDS